MATERRTRYRVYTEFPPDNILDAYCTAMHVEISQTPGLIDYLTLKIDFDEDREDVGEVVGVQLTLKRADLSQLHPDFYRASLELETCLDRGASEDCAYSFMVRMKFEVQLRYILDTIVRKRLDKYYIELGQYGVLHGRRQHLMLVLQALEEEQYIEAVVTEWTKLPEPTMILQQDGLPVREIGPQELEGSVYFILRQHWANDHVEFIHEMAMGRLVEGPDNEDWFTQAMESHEQLLVNEELSNDGTTLTYEENLNFEEMMSLEL